MFPLTEDQQLFEATTAQFLATRYASERIREMRYAPVFEPVAWKQGAELGWTSLLVPQQLGGGSISGNGLLDLLIVAYHFGRHCRVSAGLTAGLSATSRAGRRARGEPASPAVRGCCPA